MNDVNNPGIEAQKLRKELFRHARTNLKQSQRSDPYAVLSNVSVVEKSFEDEPSEEDQTGQFFETYESIDALSAKV